jgi:hypothetical protein
MTFPLASLNSWRRDGEAQISPIPSLIAFTSGFVRKAGFVYVPALRIKTAAEFIPAAGKISEMSVRPRCETAAIPTL